MQRAAILLFPLIIVFIQLNLAGQGTDLTQEEAADYFSKWLSEDVVYIISPEERAVFRNLSTPEEKERFIEQFWYRRDPDPATLENEFKTEHYRRIAYANERFTSGHPGWRMDRGRVYILHGPPDEIESHASGGAYERPMNEGGGTTSTFPFEIWRYRHIEGVGDDIVLEFVDPSLSGEYRLALNREEKDAFLQVPGAGLTLAEEMGMSSKADRPYFNPMNRDQPMTETTARDNPFYRYEVYTGVQAPAAMKYPDLRELVQVRVAFSNLSFQLRSDFFRLNDEKVLVPITVQVENKDLTFQAEGTQSAARVAVYAVLTSLGRRLVAEFDHELVARYSRDELEQGLRQTSAYQKTLILDSGQRYKLDVVVKDLNSGQVGVAQRALVVPAIGSDELSTSSIVLTSSLRVMEEAPEKDEMFVIGDVKVVPNLVGSFPSGGLLGLYFQIYNAALDQSTRLPSLTLSFQLVKDGKVLRQLVDREGRSIQYFSDRRIVVIQALGLENLAPDRYGIRIQVTDDLTGRSLELNVPFAVTGSRPLAPGQ